MKNYENMIGEVHGGRKITNLIVKTSINSENPRDRRPYKVFVVECQNCGATRMVRPSKLKELETVKCNCHRVDELKTHIGEVHGIKKIVGILPTNKMTERIYYECECVECGRQSYILPVDVLHDRKQVHTCRCKVRLTVAKNREKAQANV